jgi:adenylate cyclase
MERHPAPDSIDSLLGRAVGRQHGTIVVVDVVESVRLIEQDEAGAIARWQALVDAVVRRVLPDSGGRLVKSLGDGMMLAFPDSRPAVAASFAIQRECERSEVGVDPRRRMWLRIGAHVGEHVAGSIDVYGHSVNVAARLASIAGPGEIIISADVRDEVTDSVDAELEDLGDCWLKNLSRPVRAYRIGPPGPSPIVEAVSDVSALRPAVAVIPFTGRAVAPEHAVLGEVIAEEVIASLSRTHEIDVISRLSTSALRGREDVSGNPAALLGASYVLSGSYAVSGARVSINASLTETRSGRVVWNDTLRARTDALVWGRDPAIDRLIAAASAAVIARELDRAQRQSLPTLETFTLLISAISLMHRLSASEFDRARLMLETVIERAPRQAEPQAWLGKWHVLRVHQGWSTDPKADVALAKQRIGRALQSDSHCSLALAVDGLVQTSLLGRLDLAKASYMRAIDTNPNDPLAWLLFGTLHGFKGEGAEAVRATRRALRLSPLDPMRYYFESLAASAATAAGHYEDAIRLAERSLRANRMHTSTYRALAFAQWQLGRHQDAKDTIAAMRRLDPWLTVSQWMSRSPSRDYDIGRRYAEVLRATGLPE